MHRERALSLAKHLEGLETSRVGDGDGYCQGSWTHECGTPACVAGHAAALSRGREWVKGSAPGPISREAARWLELEEEEAAVLFRAIPFRWRSAPTARDAAATVRHMAETGQVEWRRAGG